MFRSSLSPVLVAPSCACPCATRAALALPASLSDSVADLTAAGAFLVDATTCFAVLIPFACDKAASAAPTACRRGSGGRTAPTDCHFSYVTACAARTTRSLVRVHELARTWFAFARSGGSSRFPTTYTWGRHELAPRCRGLRYGRATGACACGFPTHQLAFTRVFCLPIEVVVLGVATCASLNCGGSSSAYLISTFALGQWCHDFL